MKLITVIFVPLLLCAGPAQAGGDWRGEAYYDARPTAFARGCYWRRGMRHCSTYCYEEINGKTYCNERESEAVPQGDPYKIERPTVEEIYRHPRRSY